MIWGLEADSLLIPEIIVEVLHHGGVKENVVYLPLPARVPPSAAYSSARGRRSGRRWSLCRPEEERKGSWVSFTVQPPPLPPAPLQRIKPPVPDLDWIQPVNVPLSDVPLQRRS